MEEKTIKHYSSKHKILLVGEGDFSFSLCLAKAFGSASNMVATSLDSKGELIMNYYSRALDNLLELKKLGCTILHNGDAHTMNKHPSPADQLFDRIVFNFPHAVEVGLCLAKEVPFYRCDYQGYSNKKGSGSNCNDTFPVGRNYVRKICLPLLLCIIERCFIKSFNICLLICIIKLIEHSNIDQKRIRRRLVSWMRVRVSLDDRRTRKEATSGTSRNLAGEEKTENYGLQIQDLVSA
ncbi:heavy metal-associated isoprenylated plant protein 41-like [Prosopis cineraria]|uniref:heavy metal-associated isoprenylated plant protein 41-like n=1 Tax=Prosopis cineraria TaxID=364024 RepID=UPI00240EAF21|nr:heavy metal-associated isoprenylated plant protein 41-like [Prosopis cineraria]